MKKYSYLAILVLAFLSSCSIDDGTNPEFSFEFMPVESVIMPEEFVYGETYAIGVSYIKPNSCYQFNDFAYEIDDNEFIVAIVNIVYEDVVCNGEPVLNTVLFNFTANSTETYVFKFFQGEDETGVDEYHIIEVPVVDGRGAPIGTKN